MILNFLAMTVSSQTLLLNKRPIDKSRYSGVSGNPYYFDEPVQAFLRLKDSTEPYEVTLNINLNDFGVEVFYKDQYVFVDLLDVIDINIPHYNGIDSIIFYRVHRDLLFRVYGGVEYQLFQKPEVKIETIIQRPPGEIITKKTFIRRDTYILKTADETFDISINKKSVIEALGEEAEKAIKKQKNKVKSLNDMVSLLKVLEV
jgi:hypothetical protein